MTAQTWSGNDSSGGLAWRVTADPDRTAVKVYLSGAVSSDIYHQCTTAIYEAAEFLNHAIRTRFVQLITDEQYGDVTTGEARRPALPVPVPPAERTTPWQESAPSSQTSSRHSTSSSFQC